MYIVDQTRKSYHGSNKQLLLWLDQHKTDCVSQAAKVELQSTYKRAQRQH